MDEQRFDLWTRALAGLGTRRVLTRSVLAGALSAVLLQVGGEEAAAKCFRPGRTCNRKDPKRRKCCGGATCRGSRCRCPKGRVACRNRCCGRGKKCAGGRCVNRQLTCPKGRARCGKRCCSKAEQCAGGQCLVGQGSCPAGTDSCTGTLVFCNGNPTCVCTQRIQGGTRCSQASENFICVPCVTDAQCLQLGFPAGSSCVRADGPNCGCPTIGSCATPCGIAPPATVP